MNKKKITVLILLMGFFLNTKAQVNAGNDTTICQGNSVTLHSSSDTASNITQFFNIADDIFSGIVDIGFSFNYYGNVYTQCVLSTNVQITFDLSNANGTSTWPIGGPIPNNGVTSTYNSILGPWHDVLPGIGGIMSYGTSGIAPNRFFIFNFCNSPMFDCTNLLFTGQTIIYEGSNIIETHITDKVLCTSWNSGAAIHGLQSAGGASATVVAGRNYPTQWTTSNEGMRFTPDATFSTYTVSTIPFAPIPMLGGIQWTDINGVQLSTSQDFFVSPTITTSYIAVVEVCNGLTFHDTVTVTVASGSALFAQGNTTCPQSTDGYAAFIPQDSSVWHYEWTNASGTLIDSGTISVASDTLFNILAGQYTLTLLNIEGCAITNNFNILSANFNATVQYSQGNSSCLQTSDGFAIFTPQDTSTWAYVWTDAQNNILSYGSVNQNADTLFNMSVGQYTLVLTNSFGCTVSHTFTIQANPFTAAFTVSAAPLCDEKPVNFSNTSIGAIDNYAWSFGDGSGATTASANHVYTPAGNYNVVLIISNNIGCIDTATTSISVLPNIIADFSFEPIEGCVGEFISFTDKSNLFPIAWDWNYGDQQTDNTENTFHAFGADGQYTVSLTVTDSLCGTDTKTLPIIIHFVPDVFIGNDTSLCKYELLYLDADYPGTTYLWSTGETTQVITPPMADFDTYYSVIVNNFGCLGYDTLLAEINCDVIMPSAFSPNGDGFNDIFRPRGFRITNYTMTIFDRWGGIIFEINAPSINYGWDGKINGEDAEIGVYVYFMSATFINGEQESNSGNVSLLR